MSDAQPIVEPWLRLSSYQEAVLLVPETFDVALLGGRGGGKSYALVALAIRHCATYGNRARVLFTRQSFPGLLDLESTLRDLVPRAFEGASYNGAAHVWRIPSGASIELGCLETSGDLTRFQGRNYSIVIADEAGEWSDFSLVDRLRANLRAPEGVPCRLVLAGNPGGPGHAGLAKRFVLGREPWTPFEDPTTGSTFVLCPSTFADNEYLDQAAYQRQLEAATAGDPELGKAWITGSWAIARGAAFASVLDEKRSVLDPTVWAPDGPIFRALDSRFRLDLFLTYDHGVSAPAVAYVCLRSDGIFLDRERYYPPGSILVLDEWTSCEPQSLTRGMGYTVDRVADELKELAKRWGMHPEGVADDAIFGRTGSTAGTIGEEFRRYGVFFEPARKGDRLSGWSALRQLMADAGKPDRPGLYVSRACDYFWQTVPSLPRDPRRPDDVDTRAADHAADAIRYAICRERRIATTSELLV